jgi:hypothetical protein
MTTTQTLPRSITKFVTEVQAAGYTATVTAGRNVIDVAVTGGIATAQVCWSRRTVGSARTINGITEQWKFTHGSAERHGRYIEARTLRQICVALGIAV